MDACNNTCDVTGCIPLAPILIEKSKPYRFMKGWRYAAICVCGLSGGFERYLYEKHSDSIMRGSPEPCTTKRI